MPLYKLQLCLTHMYWSSFSQSLSITFFQNGINDPQTMLTHSHSITMFTFFGIYHTLIVQWPFFMLHFKLFEVMDYFYSTASSGLVQSLEYNRIYNNLKMVCWLRKLPMLFFAGQDRILRLLSAPFSWQFPKHLFYFFSSLVLLMLRLILFFWVLMFYADYYMMEFTSALPVLVHLFFSLYILFLDDSFLILPQLLPIGPKLSLYKNKCLYLHPHVCLARN